MSEESVMKQALSSEGPARVRRAQFRAITLGIGASALAMACSFGEIDSKDDANIPPVAGNNSSVNPTTGEAVEQPGDVGTAANGGTTAKPSSAAANPNAMVAPSDSDPFSGPLGAEVKEILQTNCGTCHIGVGSQGDFGYLLDIDQLIANKKVVPGVKEDSLLYSRMIGGTMPPAAVRVVQTPTYGQIDTVGRWIDELQLPDPEGTCTLHAFKDIDQQIQAMQADIASLDPVTEAPFTRYLTVNYSSNAGDCDRALQRQRFALFKGINSVSTNPVVKQPVAIDQDETIFRVDIRDYNWDRDIDLEDDGIVDFQDGWEAIIANPDTKAFAVEYQGDNADDLKADANTLVPFLPVNVFIQATEFGALYYSLIGGKANLFDFERDVLKIDTVAEIADDNLMRAGFENSGVSKQERVLNRFDSGVSGNLNYWISFDFDGGLGNGDVGGVTNGFEINVANQSIYDQPLDFAFAGGEAIFSLPNGLQAYYVAKADGGRLDTAPIGVVIDPAQNNGLVTNGASCHSCHNAGMITFTDTVRQYVEANKRDFDNDTYESVMAQYVDAITFQKQMDADSAVHVNALERAGVPKKTPDAVSRVYLDFQLGNIALNTAAGELSIPADELKDNLDLLDPRLGPLNAKDGYVDRNIMEDTFLDSVCILHAVNRNTPVGCP
jgi:mono/diheme cytochrome c family protein